LIVRESVMNPPPWHAQPRFALGHFPTPLEPLPRLTRELGGPRIWVKRDDCTGLASGGNKTRKLEFLIGDALAAGADTVVTFGAVQSNHARQTAAACAKAGLACHQVLSRSVSRPNPDYETNGNVLLGRLLGAQQHLCAPDAAEAYATNLLADLQSQGRKTYVIPAGGSNALGALGYAQCAVELVEQARRQGFELQFVMHASSSAGTQAGLLYGLQSQRADAAVVGINVYHPHPDALIQRVGKLHADMTSAYGGADRASPRINVNHAYIGEGYGQPSVECLDAIRMAAKLEGMLFDPVYSGKALAALIDQITLGNLNEYGDVVLIHTGGSPALYVYEHAFIQNGS